MSKLSKLLQIIYEHLKQDNDYVLLITGDEGMGKSRLGLKILDYWITKILQKELDPEYDVKRLAPDSQVWSSMLGHSLNYDLVGFDEGGQINSRNAMSSFNKQIHMAYQIIRGKNFFSILIIPSVFDIDQSFPKRRAKGLIHVYKRGSFAFYGQEGLRKIIALNQNRLVRTTQVVKPTFRERFSDYKGLMLRPYQKNKAEFMNKVLAELNKSINESSNKDIINEQISEMKEQGMTNKDIGLELGMSTSAITKRILKMRRVTCD